jgi:hypothetical protein
MEFTAELPPVPVPVAQKDGSEDGRGADRARQQQASAQKQRPLCAYGRSAASSPVAVEVVVFVFGHPLEQITHLKHEVADNTDQSPACTCTATRPGGRC